MYKRTLKDCFLFKVDYHFSDSKQGLCHQDLESEKELPVFGINMDRLEQELKAKGWQVEQSKDAGRFLCDFALTTSLGLRNDGKALFIHIPSVGYPYSQVELDQVVKDAIQSISAQ